MELIANLPVSSRVQAVEKLDWYGMRWKIETLHNILKSGCKAEEARLRTADRLANLISVLCILSRRVFWLTMINRVVPQARPKQYLHKRKIELLDRLIQESARTAPAPPLVRNVFNSPSLPAVWLVPAILRRPIR
ncbi:UNVERIFIED_ORG: hypothetical protein J2Y81_007956 [Paraburkholderia sediminicola]|nr:hypothetical protein [Paraburkholderia sediminicola]